MPTNKTSTLEWHEWLCKTNFSFLVGASHPKELVKKASEFGYRSLCINDYDGVYGIARAYLDTLRLKKDGGLNLPLNYGAEIHLTKDHDLPVLLQDTLCLVARTHKGYEQLCGLLTYAHREGKAYANVPLEKLLETDVSGLVAIQPMRGAIRRVTTGTSPQESRFLKLKDHFNSRFYLALSRHLHYSEDCWIKKTLELSRQLELRCLFSQDVFFHSAKSKPFNDLLHAIRTNKTIDQAQAHFFPNSERRFHQLKSLEKIFLAFPNYQASLKNSQELFCSMEFKMSDLKYKYPQEMIPKGKTSQGFLEELVWENVESRCGTVTSEIRQTLNHELALVKKLDFADYFLTVWDIVRWARSQKILCQGRGSAANSAICYVLGVTSINPRKFDLLFERFLSMERGDPPDIDVDFEHERREEVIQYIYKRYGRPRAAMVANVITFRSKGAVRAVGKAFGVPEEKLGQVSKLIRTKYFRQHGVEDIIKYSDMNSGATSSAYGGASSRAFGQAKVQQATSFSNGFNEKTDGLGIGVSGLLWAQMAERLRGFPRHLGIHSGGFIVSETILNRIVPQEPATMEGRTVVQWCKEDIEGLGLFKIDVLSLGMLTAVRKAFQLIEKMHGVKFGLHSIPQDDPKTYEMIQRADTAGVFQIESRAQMSMLPRLRPKTFYDLVIEIAIIRPGPIQGKIIHPYLERRSGRVPVDYPDPRLEPILRRTLGIPIFQEQAMRVAMAVGDFTAGEANELRKNIGAWNVKELERNLNPWLVKLERGMRRNKLNESFIEQTLGYMGSFSSYGFPESHSISFAYIAYASSYLKCHYPAAFFASILNSQPMGFYSPFALICSAKKDGVEVFPICINQSTWDHQLEWISEKKAHGIRLGFRLVNALGEKTAQNFVEIRKSSGQFQSISHFIEKTAIYRDEFTALAAANVFQCFAENRKDVLWMGEKIQLRSMTMAMAMPRPMPRPMIDGADPVYEWKKETSLEKIQNDFKSFKGTLGDHPAKVIKNEYWCYPVPVEKITLASEFKNVRRNQSVCVFGMTMSFQAPPTAKGMVFLTLSDEGDSINLVFSPQVYERFFELIESEAFLCVSGKLQKTNEAHSVLVKQVYPRDEYKGEVVAIQSCSKKISDIGPLFEPRKYM